MSASTISQPVTVPKDPPNVYMLAVTFSTDSSLVTTVMSTKSAGPAQFQEMECFTADCGR